jgi:hypothetical protein
VGRQSKMTMRKGLQIVKQLYHKFSGNQDFIVDFTETFYKEIVAD